MSAKNGRKAKRVARREGQGGQRCRKQAPCTEKGGNLLGLKKNHPSVSFITKPKPVRGQTKSKNKKKGNTPSRYCEEEPEKFLGDTRMAAHS